MAKRTARNNGTSANLGFEAKLWAAADRAQDTFGRAYEHCLSHFASAESKSARQFYTPSHVVRVLAKAVFNGSDRRGEICHEMRAEAT